MWGEGEVLVFARFYVSFKSLHRSIDLLRGAPLNRDLDVLGLDMFLCDFDIMCIARSV